MFSLTDYNYSLPEDLIAQKPVSQRDRSRLLHLDRKNGNLSHHYFYELEEFLSPSDIIVVNNTEVIPGRIFGKKETGGKAEILILNYGENSYNKNNGDRICKCLIKAKHPKTGTVFLFDHGLKGEVVAFQDGVCTMNLTCPGDFETILYQIGNVPLPPYIKRDEQSENDKTAYQTVYASQKGAIAAPTAGLHFSDNLLEKIKAKGIKIVAITLHVGYGTFLPVRVSDIREHKMHSEWYFISHESAAMINQAKKNGSRVIVVGTTCMRTLEYASDKDGNITESAGYCDLFIYPGYKFKVADAMITNFHLPKSTLLMLVSAFAGHKNILNAYKEAIDKRYRFYSYGDAMLIL